MIGVCNSAEPTDFYWYCTCIVVSGDLGLMEVRVWAMFFSKVSVSGEWKWGEYNMLIGFQTTQIWELTLLEILVCS